MTPLEARVRHALGNSLPPDLSPWSGLMDLFRSDREAFYLLACDGIIGNADPILQNIAELARRVRSVVRSTYQIDPSSPGEQANLRSRSGEVVGIPSELVDEVRQFLHQVDGKGLADAPGKDYEGAEISEAEIRFKLGERDTWEADRQRLQTRQTSHPLVLRVDPQDLKCLESQPAYVTHGLVHLARKTVLAPTAVFEGLNRGEGSLERFQKGWTFCGKPRKAYNNEGRPISVPENMIYSVYADRDGFVFDWDWVQENPEEPGCPINRELRFGNPVSLGRDVVLELPSDIPIGRFDASKASYSWRGDCIFCYLSDRLAYADRINHDLTIFRQVDKDKVTGFKIKNVQRILNEEKDLHFADTPDLRVSVLPMLRATLKHQHEVLLRIYEVLIEAWCTPPEVMVRRPDVNAIPHAV